MQINLSPQTTCLERPYFYGQWDGLSRQVLLYLIMLIVRHICLVFSRVVCRELGYYGGTVQHCCGDAPPVTGTIWLDHVFCQGEETSLSHCDNGGLNVTRCQHSHDVWVLCDLRQALEGRGLKSCQIQWNSP